MSSEVIRFGNASNSQTEIRDDSSCDRELPADAAFAREQLVDASAADPSEASDEWLLEKVRSGVEDALSVLFYRYAQTVRNIALRIVHDEGEADDLVQEVFLFVFRHAARFKGTRQKPGNWIVHVAYQKALDRRRYLKNRPVSSSHELENDLLREDRSSGRIPGKQLAPELSALLTPQQRLTITLFFFEEYALKEIAELTGWSVANVRSYYYRGLSRLRIHLQSKKTRER